MDGLYKISFLVPTLGARYDELKRLLESLKCQQNENVEVVIVAQGNYEKIEELCSEYNRFLIVKFVMDDKKGLSRARNLGLPYCTGDIIVLSDDDCWYPDDVVADIQTFFCENNCDILLTQIYDRKKDEYYKNYSMEKKVIKTPFALLSRSSIEIAFKRELGHERFDELFGLGAEYVCCEEVDFLLRQYNQEKCIVYVPSITVFHEKKERKKDPRKIIAKGALYAKNFNIVIGILICIRDVILKKENNFKQFFEGYYEYVKRES